MAFGAPTSKPPQPMKAPMNGSVASVFHGMQAGSMARPAGKPLAKGPMMRGAGAPPPIQRDVQALHTKIGAQ